MSYELEEATNASFSGAQPVYTGSNLSHQITNNPGMPPTGVRYYYRVRAQNGSGYSTWTVDSTGCLVLIPPPGDVPTMQMEDDPAGAPVPVPDSDGRFTAVWGAATGAAGYEVEEASNAAFAGSGVVYSAPNDAVTRQVVLAKPNGTYYYRVRALNSSGGSTNWTVATNNPVQVLQAPPAPGTLTVPGSSSTGNYTVSWTTSSTATSYELQESSDGGMNWSPAYTGSNLSFGVTGKTGPPPTGTTYHYRVRASNASGQSGWTVSGNGCLVLFAPPSPGSITVPGTTWTGNYQVTWGPSPCDTYELEESMDAGFTSPLVVYNGTAQFFDVTGKMATTPLPSMTYYYRVRARNTSGPSGWATGGNACQLAAPPAPTGLTCPAMSADGAWQVSWNALPGGGGIVTYVLEESSDGGMNWSVVYTGPNTTAAVTGKTTGTFTYRVSATNPVGTGSPSGTVTCQMVAPAAPMTVTVPGTSISGYYVVGWTGSQGATGYVLEESSDGGMNWNGVFTGNGTSYFVTGRTDGTYWYRVSASNGVGSSGWTQSGNGCVVTLQAPPAPGNITVPASSSTGSYTVSWPQAWGATGYELQEAMDTGFMTAVTIYAGSNTGFTVVGKANGTYYYRVRSTNPVGMSGYTAGTNGCQVQLLPPGTPGNFTVPFSSFSGIYSLVWTPGSGAMWYEVEEDEDPVFGSPQVVYLGGGTNCVIKGRTMGTYYYRIRSANTVGVSGWVPGSNGILVAVVAPALGAFSGPANPGATREVPGATNVPMMQLGLAAGSGGAVDVTDLTVHGSGTGNEFLGVLQVRLWDDANGDGVASVGETELGTGQTYMMDDGSVTFSGFTVSLSAGGIRMLLVTYDFQGSAVPGEDYRVEWNANGDLQAWDTYMPPNPIVPQGAPAVGGVKTVASMGAGDLQVFRGMQSPAAVTVLPGTTGQVVAQLNLVASSLEGVNLSSLRVWGVGSGNDLLDLTSVSLVYDADGNGIVGVAETVVGTGTYTADNGTVTFVFTPTFLVAAGASEKFLVVYAFQGGIAGRWQYASGMLTGGDAVTSGVTSTMPATVTGTPALGEYVTIDTPPPPMATIDPEYSLGGCAGGTGGGEAPFWLLPFALLALALVATRRTAQAPK
jgi:hypothetical protein